MPTFFFTDIEGSTGKWERFKDGMAEALKRHDILLKECVDKHNGHIVKHTGDGIFAVFEKGNPLECAIECQRKFFEENFDSAGGLRIRIAIHRGLAQKRGKDYYGKDVNKTARLLSTGWGGQILITEEVAKNFASPENAEIMDLGTHKLKDLSEPQKIYQLYHPSLPLKKFPPLKSLSNHPNNLPVQTTPLIGREREISEIIEILKNPECRILTITGPGGIGKTRLAIHTGAETIENFSDGVFFVPLESIDLKELVPGKIADSIGFNFYVREDPIIQLINYLKERKILLIMDNFEHILEASEIISKILKDTEGIKFLNTSREVLNIKGEWVYPLGGLEYDGAELFINGAKRVKPDFNPSDEDKKWIRFICQIVHGLPLAIEIASSWIKILSCKEIAEEIQKSFDFLFTSLKDIPERHRSLRAVFDYSWKLLNEDEKRAIMYLSIFKGGFTKDAVDKIGNIRLNTLLSLSEKSLIKRENSRHNILLLISKYGEEKLKENQKEYNYLRRSYISYYGDFIKEKEKYMRKPDHKLMFEKPVSEEIENIIEAWRYAVEDKPLEEIDKFIDPLYFYYHERARYQEGKLIFEMAENSLKDLKNREGLIVYSKILLRLGIFYSDLGYYRESEECIIKSLDISKKFDLESEVAKAYNLYGGILYYRGDYSKAEKFFKKSLEIAKKLNDEYEISKFMNNIGTVYMDTKKYDRAKKLFKKNLEISEKIGYKKMIAIAFISLGIVFQRNKEYRKADEFYKKGLELALELESKFQISSIYLNMGVNYEDMGDNERAKEYYEKSLKIAREIGYRRWIVLSLGNLANLSLEKGNYKEAERLFSESLKLSIELGNHIMEVVSLWGLGDTFIKRGEPDKGIKYIFNSLKKAFEIKAEDYYKENYIKRGLLSSASYFVIKKDYKTAFKIFNYLKENYKEEFEKEVNKELLRLKVDLDVSEKVSKEENKKNLKDFTEEIIEKIKKIS